MHGRIKRGVARGKTTRKDVRIRELQGKRRKRPKKKGAKNSPRRGGGPGVEQRSVSVVRKGEAKARATQPVGGLKRPLKAQGGKAVVAEAILQKKEREGQ